MLLCCVHNHFYKPSTSLNAPYMKSQGNDCHVERLIPQRTCRSGTSNDTSNKYSRTPTDSHGPDTHCICTCCRATMSPGNCGLGKPTEISKTHIFDCRLQALLSFDAVVLRATVAMTGRFFISWLRGKIWAFSRSLVRSRSSHCTLFLRRPPFLVRVHVI